MPIFGPDISSYQGTPNMAAVAAAGNDFCIIKVTESVNYINPTWQANRDAAHAAGMAVGLYHFSRDGDPIAEAQWFVNDIAGGVRPGEFLVLDWEVAGDAATWSKAFLDEVYRLTGVRGFVYLNQYYDHSFDWSAVVAAGYPLWIAVYDGDPYTFPQMAYWGTPHLKQYTDSAAIPGIAGNCDRNSFDGDRNALLAYAKGGSGAARETGMPYIVQTPDGSAYVVDTFSVQHIPDPPTLESYKSSGLPVAQIGADQLALQIRDAGARRADLLNDISRFVLCRTPDDPKYAGTPWLLDMIVGEDGKTGEIDDDVKQILDKLSAIAPPPAPVAVDPAALAAALAPLLLADPKNVDALGASIAGHLQLTSRPAGNG